MEISMGMHFLSQKKIEETEFDQIMEEHKKWLENHETGKRAELRDVDLSNMDLSGRDFSHANMEGVILMFSSLGGANLSNANLQQAVLHKADLSKATIDGTIFVNASLNFSNLNECKGEHANFSFACLWDCNVKKASLPSASFFDAKVCDCDFTGSNLENARFTCADLDNACFADTNLRNAGFSYVMREYWSDFTNADMTGVNAYDVDFGPENLKGVKGLYLPLCCPEEGAFIAWKKCREGRVVKLLIPEHAERKGHSIRSCRASEAVVLEIYDEAGNPVEEAESIYKEGFMYVKGATVIPEKVNHNTYGDVEGIHFVLSRAETAFFSEKEEDEEEFDDDDDEEWDI